MALKAKLVSGTPNTMDYTRPEVAVSPGGVVIVGGIAGVDVCGGEADEMGSLAYSDAIFEVEKILEQAFDVGATVYWNATAGGDELGAATASVEDVILGICRKAAAEDDATVEVELCGAPVHSS